MAMECLHQEGQPARKTSRLLGNGWLSEALLALHCPHDQSTRQDQIVVTIMKGQPESPNVHI